MSYRNFVEFPSVVLCCPLCFFDVAGWASISLAKLKKIQTLVKKYVFLIQKFECKVCSQFAEAL